MKTIMVNLKQCIRYACRVDKRRYRHDRRVDKRRYRHDRRADSQCRRQQARKSLVFEHASHHVTCRDDMNIVYHPLDRDVYRRPTVKGHSPPVQVKEP